MVATAYRAQVGIPLYGDPNQNSSNTFYFLGAVGSSQSDDLAEMDLRLTNFYNRIDGNIYPSAVVGSPANVTFYDMSDPPERTPIAVDTIPLTPVASAAYPSDVSICLSYRADMPSGVNRRRRRGRLFLGPVTVASGTAVTGQGIRVLPAIVTTLLDAAEDLALVGVTPIVWAMWSETDGVARPIVEASVDNQFDTRRSRDNRASTRTFRSIP